MKQIFYYLTENGKNKKTNDSKYLENERIILDILLNERKNINQIREILERDFNKKLDWYATEKLLKNLEKEGLVKKY